MYDFHTHTFLSDGVLSPIELIRRAQVRGYRAIAVTDHVGLGNLEWVVKTLVKDCGQATQRWDILALPGVEVTHTEPEAKLVDIGFDKSATSLDQIREALDEVGFSPED